VGQLLREYRTAYGITQAALADRLGFDQSYVSKVESGAREMRDLEALRRIAEVRVVAPEDLGLSREELNSEASGLDVDAEAVVARSQREWRMTREHLNHSRGELARIAGTLYDGLPTEGCRGPLLMPPGWLFAEPLDFHQIALRWSGAASSPPVTGGEPEADAVLPLRTLDRRYHRYTRAIRDLDRPALFESRASFRLIDVDNSIAASPCLTFGHTTYYRRGRRLRSSCS